MTEQWECTNCGNVVSEVPGAVPTVDARYPIGQCMCWKKSKANPLGVVYRAYAGPDRVSLKDATALQRFLKEGFGTSDAYKRFLRYVLDIQPVACWEYEAAASELHQTASAKFSTMTGLGVLIPTGRHPTNRGTDATAFSVTPSVALWLTENP